MSDFNQLIPELKDWNDGRGIDVQSWIGCVGDFQKAIGYSTIFWPRFVEIEGCVLRGGLDLENVQQWLKQCGGNCSAAEATINHLHLEDLHYVGCPDATPERLIYLGRVLKEIYECKLARDFPKRDFVVVFDEPESGRDTTEYILTFYQKATKSYP